MSDILKLRKVVQTCSACPSQWDARTPDGRDVYVRYRSSHLSIHVASRRGQDALDGREAFYFYTGRGMDGQMEWKEVCELAADAYLGPVNCSQEWYNHYKVALADAAT